jgi:hypothetical protein
LWLTIPRCKPFLLFDFLLSALPPPLRFFAFFVANIYLSYPATIASTLKTAALTTALATGYDYHTIAKTTWQCHGEHTAE